MRTRVLAPLAVVTLVMVFGAWAQVRAAQAPSGTKSFDPATTNTDAAIKAATDAVRAAAAAANWTPPRTPWGDPDLQGYYLSLSYTPLERPADLAGKAFYTEQEAIAAFRKAVEADAEVDPRTVHYDWKEYGMDAWQSPVRPNLRTALIVDPADEPEPDVAIVPGGPRDHLAEHPRAAALVVEVADSSLEYDRGDKAQLYARAGFAEYWIVNLRDRCLEVHRQPSPGGYGDVTTLAAGTTVVPLEVPGARIAVASLLP